MEELSDEEESWFLKKICLEFILSQFFTFVEFSCVNFTNQIFILGLFHSARGDNEPHIDTI